MKIQNFIGHLNTVNDHRKMVKRHCFKVGLYKQGLLHDLSKYAPKEFLAGVKYYQGNQSPNNVQRRTEGYSEAWLHHKGRNKHHMEYWIDYSVNHKVCGMVGMKMPVNYVVEMFCDRVAASKIYNKEAYHDSAPLQYYLNGRHRYIMHPDTNRLLYRLLKMLSLKGEEYTFWYIRKKVLPKKDY